MNDVLFKGAYGVIVTPFLEDGTVNYEALGKQVDYVCDSGIKGLVACGSTGEFTYLSIREMKHLMAFVSDINAGRKQLICGATAANYHETVQLMEFIDSLGADGALVAPPYYFQFNDDDVRDFYFKLAHAPGTTPIIAYHIPQCTSGISMEVYRELLGLERIRGIKNSGGSCLQIMQQISLRNELRPDFSVMTGSDESIYALVNSGADGSLTAIAYLYPELVMDIYEHLNDEQGLHNQMEVVKLASLAGEMPFPLGYKILGEASGKMYFGEYLQAVSDERKERYQLLKDRMHDIIKVHME